MTKDEKKEVLRFTVEKVAEEFRNSRNRSNNTADAIEMSKYGESIKQMDFACDTILQ